VASPLAASTDCPRERSIGASTIRHELPRTLGGVWPDPPPPGFPPPFAELWYVTYHALVWLDLYLSGVPEEAFAPPAPFAQGELAAIAATPAHP
jgi:hypothetical protein